MKKPSTMKASPASMINPIQVGAVASFVMIEAVAFDAFVLVPVDSPVLVALYCSSCRIIMITTRTIDATPIPMKKPDRLPT